MANQKEYAMLFSLNAQMGGGFTSAFTKAQAQIAEMRKEISSLSKTQADITAYQKQQSALDATRQKLVTLQQQYDNIQREIQETEGFSSALANQLLTKQQQIDKTNAAIERQSDNLHKLSGSLEDAGIDTKDLATASSKLAAEMDDLRKQQEEVEASAMQMGAAGAQAIAAYQQMLVSSGIQDALRAIYDEMKACADASVDFESALTGVDKTSDLSAAELKEISAAVKELSTDIPVTTDEMLAIGEVAGQLGIAKENLLDFSTTMSMLSTATTMAAEDGATMLAQFANITRMDPAEYSRLASAIVDLGNSYATTEQKITEMSQGIAASGSLAGMSEADMLGLSAAVSSLGIETQAGSTSVSKLISELMTAVETGERLEDFAHVAGMSADEFAKAWGDNAVGALESFIVGLSDTDRLGQSAIVTLTDLGITETRMQRTILSLSNSGDLLTRTVATANQAWAENVALSEEAAKRYATTASQQVLMQNAVNNLRIAIGDNYTPTLRRLYAVGTDVLSGMTQFVEQNPALVKSITAVVAVLGTATAALTAYATIKKVVDALNLVPLIAGVGPAVAAVAAVVGLTAGLAALSAEADKEAAAVREMTEASRAEYYQLQELKVEYEEACALYGETSDEARYLAWQIDELNTSFESNRQTLSEYIEACEAANESLRSMLDANRNTFTEIGSAEGTALALIHRLQELSSQTEITADAEAEMRAIIASLNSVMPELALNYEDATSGATDYAAAVEAAIKAQAEQQRYNAALKGSADALLAQESAKKQLDDAKDQQTSAQERLIAAQKAYAAYQQMIAQTDSSGFGSLGLTFSAEYKELIAAEEAYASYTAQVEESQGLFDRATQDYEDYQQVLVDYVEETRAAEDGQQEMAEAVDILRSSMRALSEAYTEAYNAAYQSVSGQYSLWDEAAEVVATSAQTINSNLEGQITYWQSYNANLASLGDRAGDIEGLTEMLASFADGSADSVNAVAGMATASDEDLRRMVANWQTLQEEQVTTADSIAELVTGFSGSMEELQRTFGETIQGMDLSEEAAASASSTIQSFIDQADDMLPQVQAAYAKLGQAAVSALGSYSGTEPSYASGRFGYTVVPAHAGGTTYAEDVFLAGEYGPELIVGKRGASVFPAQETQRIIDALPAAGNGIQRVEINFAPVYNLDGSTDAAEIDGVLRSHDEAMREYILQVVSDALVDAKRTDYA